MYHYRESGLRNVWLVNGVRQRQTPYGPATSIANVAALHRAIGLWIVRKPGRLTGAELRFLRQELDLSQRRLAEILGCEEQTVSLWERRGRMPKVADRFVRALYRETVEGNAHIRDIVARLVDKDAREHARKEQAKAKFALRARAWRQAA
jgi:DNA-binding transcriptional regulator YiaG